MIKNYMYTGSFLVAKWLGFQAFTAGAWVQSLVGELRSCKPKIQSLLDKVSDFQNYFLSLFFTANLAHVGL